MMLLVLLGFSLSSLCAASFLPFSFFFLVQLCEAVFLAFVPVRWMLPLFWLELATICFLFSVQLCEAIL
jgi:hypothetical protein